MSRIERLAHLGAAVEDVTDLHVDGGSARPPELGVDEARGLQEFREGVEVAVHVPDGDHPRARRLARGS